MNSFCVAKSGRLGVLIIEESMAMCQVDRQDRGPLRTTHSSSPSVLVSETTALHGGGLAKMGIQSSGA